jgi:Flp pilus assembly protein TadB
MNFGNILIIAFVCYYINFLLKMWISKSSRDNMTNKNIELEQLRHIQNKTLEQQKRFIDLKEPKSSWKFSWYWLWCCLIQLVTYIILYYMLYRIFTFFKIDIIWWIAVVSIITGSYLINFLLKKIKLNVQ